MAGSGQQKLWDAAYQLNLTAVKRFIKQGAAYAGRLFGPVRSARGADRGADPGKKAGVKKKAPKPAKEKVMKKVPEQSKTLAAMAEKFAPHKVPALLAELCNYWDKHPVFFCGSFEIDPDQYDSARDWFQGNEAGWSRIKLFGVDGIHSLYGIWLYDGRTSDNAPIIYLGGEGEGSTILASTWPEFLSILAANG